ncbi:hypothetical protein [Mycolicibacterium senegalense]|uniref:hypothetical protein n=1 Tax=Mycolicibacterium senegalense TaxID=1796 RepID=UPI0036433829
MSYPDPYQPQQQPPPGPYPPAPPGYGYPPSVGNGGYPPAQTYGAPHQPPYYPAPPAPQPPATQDDGNSWGWQILQTLLFFGSGTTGHSLGDNARERVKTELIILGVAIIGIAIVIGIAVIASK